MNRYVFIFILQIENSTFTKLGTAFIDGMSKFIPFSSFESRLFLARRLAGVPGYQYGVDPKKEYIIGQIFTDDELDDIKDHFTNLSGQECRKLISGQECRKLIMFEKNIYLFDFKRIHHDKKNLKNDNEEQNVSVETQEKMKFFGLQHSSELQITKVDEDNMEIYYKSNRRYKKLSRHAKFLVKANICIIRLSEKRIFKPFVEAAFSLVLIIMRESLI